MVLMLRVGGGFDGKLPRWFGLREMVDVMDFFNMNTFDID